jgi:exosortase
MAGAVAWALAIAWLYGSVAIGLARNWQSDPTYSHGWVVAPIAIVLAWQRRKLFRELPRRPATAGFLVLGVSLVVYVIGTLGAELFLTRVSFIGVVAGTVLLTFGPAHLRAGAFPLAFLLFMIPLPSIVFERLAVELQLVASALGERILQAADVAVLRDGNVLRLATVSLEVNEACSGIRSLMTLVAVTTLMAYVLERGWLRRLVFAACAVPLAIGLNGIRIALTGFAALRYGPAAASGTVHEAAGLMVFAASVACLCGLHLALRRVATLPPVLEAA